MRDFFADRRNTPHLKKNTRLLFLFYLFTSANFCVTAAMSRGADAILLRAAWAMGILFLLLAPVVAADNRRGEQRLWRCDRGRGSPLSLHGHVRGCVFSAPIVICLYWGIVGMLGVCFHLQNRKMKGLIGGKGNDGKRFICACDS